MQEQQFALQTIRAISHVMAPSFRCVDQEAFCPERQDSSIQTGRISTRRKVIRRRFLSDALKTDIPIEVAALKSPSIPAGMRVAMDGRPLLSVATEMAGYILITG